jgi:hypothetical protein
MTSLAVRLGIALALTSCSGPSEPARHEPYAEIFEDRISLRTGHFEISRGDVFECFYTPLITDRDIIVGSATGTQEEGGHHLTVHYTMNHRDPQHHACNDEEMATWRQVGAAEAPGTPAEYWVEGLGMRIPAGAQIVLQAHYINLADHTRTVEDAVDVHFLPPDRLVHLGAPFVIHDDAWEIPARQQLRHTAECVVQRDHNIGLLLGHLHEWGVRFSLQRQKSDGTIEMLYDEPWEAAYSSHPPVNTYGLEEPLLLHAGDRLIQTCEWMNPEAEPMLFPREMCVAYMVSFPSESGEMEFCEVVERNDEVVE